MSILLFLDLQENVIIPHEIIRLNPQWLQSDTTGDMSEIQQSNI